MLEKLGLTALAFVVLIVGVCVYWIKTCEYPDVDDVEVEDADNRE